MTTVDQSGKVVAEDVLDEVTVTAKRLPVRRIVGVNWNMLLLAAALAFVGYVVSEETKPARKRR